jgi:crotonobetainyl-CoA:carnitine CoA-transferase CaiB-like acyl-CoA transferase
LIADIAGGTYPALFNILLALRARDAGKGGAHLDIAMAENLFPFLYWAMGDGQAAGQWPGNGDALVTGGSPRYQLYATADGRMLAAAPLEEKFWGTFCEAIGLDPALREDTRDPEATKAGIAALIASRDAAHWDDVFEKADCCCTIVQTIEDALEDPHFAARGVFSRKVANEAGAIMRGLPTPVARTLAADPTGTASAPQLGADNDNYTPRPKG